MKRLVTALVLLGCSARDVTIAAEETGHVTDKLTAQHTRALPLHWLYNPNEWIVDEKNGALMRTSTCDDPEPHARIALLEVDEGSVPHGAVVINASIFVEPCPTARLALPAGLPSLSTYLADQYGDVVDTVGWGLDDSITGANYGQRHEFKMDITQPTMLDRERQRLFLSIAGEYDTNALGGMRLLGASVTYLY